MDVYIRTRKLAIIIVDIRRTDNFHFLRWKCNYQSLSLINGFIILTTIRQDTQFAYALSLFLLNSLRFALKRTHQTR